MNHDDDRGASDRSRSETGRSGAPRSSRSGGPAEGGGAAAAQASRSLPFWQELAVLLTIALLLALGIKALFVQAFYIPSGSMDDTLVFRDRILVQKVSYWGPAGPERGDVVVFADPGGWLDESRTPRATNPAAKALEMFGLYPTGGHLVKRVIGVGGDRVTCCDKRGLLRVNGVALHERSYIKRGGRPSELTFDVEVPEGYLWVMGDNRAESADSRVHLGDPGGGFVPEEDVVGKVFAVVWPASHFTFLGRPDTFSGVGAP